MKHLLMTLLLGLSLAAVGCPSTGTDDDDSAVADDDDDAASAACVSFCDLQAATCTGANEQYADEAACLSACAGYAVGANTDTTGDTLGCRNYHLGAAAGDPGQHCPHTGADGGGVCID